MSLLFGMLDYLADVLELFFRVGEGENLFYWLWCLAGSITGALKSKDIPIPLFLAGTNL
jgi:hypothetical protein